MSGHSTYSRAAAEVLAHATGSPYFPGGLGTYEVEANNFLAFESGPSEPFTLQWATYRDAADQCALSRIWGGIHPPMDDIRGRVIGSQVADLAIAAYEEEAAELSTPIVCPEDIDASGNVGIGTSTPSHKLHIEGGALGGTAGDTLDLLRLKGTTSNGDQLIFESNRLANGADWTTAAHKIYRQVDSTLMGYMQFGANSGDLITFGESNNEYMRIDGSGNVGIGTPTVRDKIHIYGDGQTTANIADSGTRDCFLRLSQSGASVGTGGGILFASQQGDSANSVGFAAIKGLLTVGTGNTVGHLAFSVRNTTTATSLQEAMRITNSGDVGIGASSPDYKLHVNVPISSGSERTVELAHGADSNFKLLAANGSSTNTSGEEVSRFGIYYEGTGWDTYTTYIRGGSTQLGSLAFNTANTEKARIDSSGSFYVGYSSGGATTSGCVKAKSYNTKQGINGALQGNVFNIDWSSPNANLWIDGSNIGTFTFTSDYRVKDNVVPITSDCISRIKQLRPVQFEYTDYGIFSADGIVREGFIAHEVQEVIPSGADGVKDAENQLQSLKTDAILSVTVKALQEAVAKIETLEAKVAALEVAG